MDRLRLIEDKDYPALRVYWALTGKAIEPSQVYPQCSSYVYERSGDLLYAVALYLIQGLDMAYVEAVVRNPSKKADFNALAALQAHLENKAREQGCQRIVGFPSNERLLSHYTKLGYNKVGTAFLSVKEL